MPALRPTPRRRADRARVVAEDEGRKNAGFRFDGSGRSFQSESVNRHVAEGRKGAGAGAGAGADWFDANLCQLLSKSPRRKAASAKIAKIPLILSTWIGRAWLPIESDAA